MSQFVIMEFKDIVSITGKPGLFKLDGYRANGAVVCNLDDKKKIFVSARQHMYTPLDNITIFTMSEGKPLKEVFQMIEKSASEGNEIPTPKSDGTTLRNYFTEIVPDHNTDKVYTSDIKKIIQWFHLLKKHEVSFD